MTALDVVKAAFRRLGVLAEGETPSAAMAADGLEELNNMVDQWAAERLTIYTITRSTFTIVSGTAAYNVGTGTAIAPRPEKLDHVNYQDTALSPTQERQLTELTPDAWSKVPIKDLTSLLPTCYYYNPTFTYGTLTLWPVPTSSTLEGVIYFPDAISQFTALTTAVSLPPGYRMALIDNLAMQLAPDYGVQPNPALVEGAQSSMYKLKRANIVKSDLSVDAGALIQGRNRHYWYDINVGP